MSSPALYVGHVLFLAAGIWLLLRIGSSAEKMFTIATRLLVVVMFLWLFWISDPVNAFEDYVDAYYVAGVAALRGVDSLSGVLTSGVLGFVNLPIIAYLFAPLALLTARLSAVAFTAIGVLAIYLSWRLLKDAFALDRRPAAVLALLMAANGPLLYSVKEGNTSHMVLLLLVTVLPLLRQRREYLAGTMLGIAALIKLPLLLLGIYFACKGRWRVVAGGAAVILATVLLSVAVFGVDTHLRWYAASVAPYGRDPVAAFNVQSIYALLSRMETGGTYLLDWSTHRLGPLYRMSAVFLVLIVLAAVALPMLRSLSTQVTSQSGRADAGGVADKGLEVEFMMWLIAAIVCSPLSWSHYYLWLLVPTAYFLGQGAALVGDKAGRYALAAAVLLMSPPVVLMALSSYKLTELYARLGVSHLLFAGLLLLGLLFRARWSMDSIRRVAAA